MKIKISPENDMEKQKMKEITHLGVREFFIFGNKKDGDNDLIDFHDWTGSYRYLIGSLYYFADQVVEEQKAKQANKMHNEVSSFGRPTAKNNPPFLKRGKIENDGKPIELVEVKAEEIGKTVPFNDEFVPQKPSVEKEPQAED